MMIVAPLVVAAASTGAVVLSQQPAAADRDGPSFLQILIGGAELPGLVILVMSVAAVTIIFEQFRRVRRKTMAPEDEVADTRQMLEARRYRECVARLQSSRSMFGDVLLAGLQQGRHGYAGMHEAAEARAGVWTRRLFRRAEYLHILGNLGPLMGLLGTVLGMIRAFSAMQQAHGAYRPEDLAGGIALALVNTFLGLALAIVALGFFGVCRNRVDALTITATATAMELLEHFRTVDVGTSASVVRRPRVEPDSAQRSGVMSAAARPPQTAGKPGG
jgi:biopolymer transport protein ExbB